MAKAGIGLANVVRAELFRRYREIRARLLMWSIGSVLIYGLFIQLQYRLFTHGGGLSTAMNSTAAWVGFMSIGGSVASEIAKSRKNATIALLISQNASGSFLRNTFALAISEVASLAPSLVILWLSSCLTQMGFIPPMPMLLSCLLGLAVGLALAPAVWAAALFFDNPSYLQVGLALGFFIWIGADARPDFQAFLPPLHAVGPLRLMSAWNLAELSIWVLFWAAMGIGSILVARLLLRFIREGGDMILDS
jgi:hypothetical protein